MKLGHVACVPLVGGLDSLNYPVAVCKVEEAIIS